MGYERFVAHGGDGAGAFVSLRLGHEFPEAVIGVHVSFPVLPGMPHGVCDDEFTTEERDVIEAAPKRGPADFVHVLIHANKLQTLARAMHIVPLDSLLGF